MSLQNWRMRRSLGLSKVAMNRERMGRSMAPYNAGSLPNWSLINGSNLSEMAFQSAFVPRSVIDGIPFSQGMAGRSSIALVEVDIIRALATMSSSVALVKIGDLAMVPTFGRAQS